MIQYLIAGLVGGAVALAKKPKKMEQGGRLDLNELKRKNEIQKSNRTNQS